MKPSSLAEALKTLKAQKPSEGYLAIRFRHDRIFLLPYSAGVALLQALSQAERLTDLYDSERRLVPVAQNDIEITLIPARERDNIKLAGLLGVSVPQIEEMRLLEGATQ